MDVLHRSRHRPRTARERCPGAARPTRTCIPRATVCGAVRPPREAAPALSRAAHQPAEARGGLIDERRKRVDEPKHIPRADPRLRWGAGVSAAAPRTEAFPSHFVHLPRSAFTPTHPLLLPLPVALPYSVASVLPHPALPGPSPSPCDTPAPCPPAPRIERSISGAVAARASRVSPEPPRGALRLRGTHGPAPSHGGKGRDLSN